MDQRDTILQKVLQREAFAFLNQLEMEEPDRVEKARWALYQRWFREEIKLDAPVSVDYLKQMLAQDKAADANAAAMLNRRRFGDDDDSDIDLDGL